MFSLFCCLGRVPLTIAMVNPNPLVVFVPLTPPCPTQTSSWWARAAGNGNERGLYNGVCPPHEQMHNDRKGECKGVPHSHNKLRGTQSQQQNWKKNEDGMCILMDGWWVEFVFFVLFGWLFCCGVSLILPSHTDSLVLLLLMEWDEDGRGRSTGVARPNENQRGQQKMEEENGRPHMGDMKTTKYERGTPLGYPTTSRKGRVIYGRERESASALHRQQKRKRKRRWCCWLVLNVYIYIRSVFVCEWYSFIKPTKRANAHLLPSMNLTCLGQQMVRRNAFSRICEATNPPTSNVSITVSGCQAVYERKISKQSINQIQLVVSVPLWSVTMQQLPLAYKMASIIQGFHLLSIKIHLLERVDKGLSFADKVSSYPLVKFLVSQTLWGHVYNPFFERTLIGNVFK